MGYRLHVTIPNVKPYDKDLELGKQYDPKWDNFNDKWFGNELDGGRIRYYEIEEFYNEMLAINNELDEDKLYNLDILKEMVDYAIEHKLDVYFLSY